MNSSFHNLPLGIGSALTAYLFFSGAALLVPALPEDFPMIQTIFIQNVVSFLCVLPLALRKGWQRLKTRELSLHLRRDLFGVLSYYFYFLAIRYLDFVDAVALNYTAPFFVPLFWWIWKKEKVEKTVWWSVVIGFFGVIAILNPSSSIFQEMGALFGISAGCLSGLAFVTLRLLALKQEPTSRSLFYFFLVSALLTLPFAAFFWAPLSESLWFTVLGIGVFTAAGQIFLTAAYRYGAAAILSPLCYSALIYSYTASYFIYGTEIGWRTYLGTALIVLGGTLTYLLRRQPHSLKDTFETPDKQKPPV